MFPLAGTIRSISTASAAPLVRPPAGDLLAELAGSDDKPDVVGDAAYGDAATRDGLQAQGFTVVAKCPPGP